ASADVACDDCDQNTAPCVARLCQPAFTITADDPLLCADGSMTNDMTNTALYMHNYYRGLLGGGWAEDKISTYAPLAKAMPQLEYECAAIAKEASDRAKACKETPDDPTASRSQNYLVIKDVNMDKEDALKQMAYDQTKQVGCSVETCTKKGFTLVVCQYDQQISDGKKIYETGKSGDKACAGCATKKCGDLQGLCAP
ncbi:SCP-like protein, partial [Necator americanus]